MKVIDFKIVLNDDGQPLIYQDVLVTTLKTHPQGMNLDEMERVLRIVKTIRDAKGRVALEDADHDYVSKRLVATQWVRADSALVQFVKDVRDAPTIDANELLKEKEPPSAPS